MRVWMGTSGFSYKPWKGPFYPEKLPDGEMLSYYATQLPAVEIDNTFYRMPKKSVLEGWTEKVPESFRFTIKASRRITHFARLKGAEEPTAFLTENVRVLGSRLGAVLFQLPPNLKKDLPRLVDFLPLIPADLPAAFEFRHETWFDDEVLSTLAARNVALCYADTAETPITDLQRTAPFGYLRLRRDEYTSEDLAKWIEMIQKPGWDDLYLFFKHEDAGVGPRLARELRDLLAAK